MSDQETKPTAVSYGQWLEAALGRRELLVAGSALALAPGWALAKAGLEAKAAPVPLARLSIGYLLGSDALARPRWPVPPAIGDDGAERPFAAESIVVPATSLAAGDPRLAGGGALVRVEGLYPDAAAAVGLPASVWLDVLVRDESGRQLPFHAWGFRRGAGGSPPIRFQSWLDETDPLVLQLELRDPSGETLRADDERTSPAPGARRRAELTLGSRAGLPRLQAGVYFLGLAEAAWDVERKLPEAGEPVPAELASVVLTVESVVDES